MIVLTQCIVRYGFFIPFEVEITLSNLGFVFLVLATVLIAAGGYVINDVCDVHADKINKPKKLIVEKHLEAKQAKTIYFLLTFLGVGLGFILSNLMGKPLYFLIFAITALLLYVYAKSLKRIALVGNILVSILVGMSLFIVGIFEILPTIVDGTDSDQKLLLEALGSFSVFAFAINLVRELVKDIEDMQGDHVARYKTLPLVLGAQRTAKITAIMALVVITTLSWYAFTYLYDKKIAVAVVIFGIVGPLGYSSMKLWEATKKKDYTAISKVLKICMLIGIGAIPLITFAIKNAS